MDKQVRIEKWRDQNELSSLLIYLSESSKDDIFLLELVLNYTPIHPSM